MDWEDTARIEAEFSINAEAAQGAKNGEEQKKNIRLLDENTLGLPPKDGSWSPGLQWKASSWRAR